MLRIFRLNIVQCLLAAVFAVGANTAHATYWNVFNIEGESTEAAHIVTYSMLADMLADSNRIGDFTMPSFGRNIVGSGSDGSTYWNVFNIEGESTEAAHIVTYSMLADMLADSNRIGDFTMPSFGRNIVGSGSSVFAGGGPTGSVPEPGSLSLVALAGLLLALRTPWRRRMAVSTCS
jgi:hypothetical protein